MGWGRMHAQVVFGLGDIEDVRIACNKLGFDADELSREDLAVIFDSVSHAISNDDRVDQVVFSARADAYERAVDEAFAKIRKRTDPFDDERRMVEGMFREHVELGLADVRHTYCEFSVVSVEGIKPTKNILVSFYDDKIYISAENRRGYAGKLTCSVLRAKGTGKFGNYFENWIGYSRGYRNERAEGTRFESMPAMDEKSSILEMVENCIRYTYPKTGVQADFPVQSDELAAAFADETLPGLRESAEMTAAINQETILRSLSAYRDGSLAIREEPLTDDELDALVTSNDMERRLDPRLPRLIVTHSAHDESEPWGPPDVGGWVAWDASGSESHCEEFHTKEAAIAWLASCEAGDGPVHDWDRAQWEGRMDGGVRNWYTTCYPTDELGGQIDPGLTFRDLARLVGQGFDAFYGRACCGDSVVRERMFAEVARRVGCKYEDVYDACGELRPLTDATLGWPARPCPHEVFAKAKRAAADSAGEVEGASTIKH